MNLQRSSRLLATGAVALALIGGGVGAALTDHWAGTQTATVNLTPPPPPNVVLTVTSNSQGAVVNPIAKTVTFADYAITTPSSDPMMGGIDQNFAITSTGTGVFQVSATITSSTMPAAELAKFSIMNGNSLTVPPGVTFPLSGTPVVVASQAGPGTMYLGLSVNWAALTQAASGSSFTVTYAIDAA